MMIICNKTEKELSCLHIPARGISELVQNIVEKRLLKSPCQVPFQAVLSEIQRVAMFSALSPRCYRGWNEELNILESSQV